MQNVLGKISSKNNKGKKFDVFLDGLAVQREYEGPIPRDPTT